MSISYLDSNRFDTEIVNSDGLVLVDFFATWCGPCQMMAPILEEISEECDYVEIYKIDIDENKELCEQYEIDSVPTMIIFQQGEELERFVGTVGKSRIMNALRSLRED